MLHELPSEEGKGEWGSVPIDQCVDIEGFHYSEQTLLLVVKRGEKRRTSQRAAIVIVLSRPIYFSSRQRGIVDTPYADNVTQLLEKWREAEANSMRCR